MSAVRTLVVAILLLPLATALPPATPEPPLADFVHTDPRPREPVTFTSTSRARNDTGTLATAHNNTIIVLRWSFSDQEEGIVPTTGEQVQHTFARPGIYNVTLTATDMFLSQGSTTRIVVVPGTPPVAAFEATPDPAYRGVPVRFEDRSFDEDGDEIVEREWMIDGASYEGRNVTHAFSTLGSHEVELRVRDASGMETSIVQSIRVLNAPPTVEGSFSPSDPAAGELVTFSAVGADPDGDGAPLTFEWRFSDGVRATGPSFGRTFPAGDHTVMLRARDVEGAVSSPWIAAIAVR